MIVIYELIDPRIFTPRYVGKTQALIKRQYKHLNPSKDSVGPHAYNWLTELKRNGLKPIFNIIEEIHEFDDWRLIERFYIAFYRYVLGYPLTNICAGGLGGTYQKLTDEHRRKISEGNKGRLVSKETRDKISKAHKGRINGPLSEEHRAKIAQANKGRPGPNKGKPQPIETVEKRSKALKNRVITPEHRKKIGEANSKKKNLFKRKYRPFVDENGNVYQYQGEAAKILGVGSGTVGRVLQKQIYQTKGHTFKYLDEMTEEELNELKSKNPAATGFLGP